MHYRWIDKRLILNCSIQPKAREDRVVGVVGDFLKIRLTAPPVDGKANKTLIKFLSQQFRVKQTAITIVSGGSSRQKRVAIEKPNTIPDYIKPNAE